MAEFLRDEFIHDVSITEETILQLSEVIAIRAKDLLEIAEKTGEDKKKPFLTFILRFDNKGYKIFSTDELLQHFRRAEKIERLIITLETGESLGSNRMLGDYLELKLDKSNNENSLIQISSGRQDWVNASFSGLKDVLEKFTNRNNWMRSSWATLIIQLLGVISGFGFSLWVASKLSEQLNIESAFIISFLFVLLLFSNVWGYVNQALLNFVHGVYPSINFYRENKDRKNWMLQAVIGGVATACTVYLLGAVLSYIGEFINALVK